MSKNIIRRIRYLISLQYLRLLQTQFALAFVILNFNLMSESLRRYRIINSVRH